MRPSMTAPEIIRILVKLAASMRPAPSARRHSMELAANASIAIAVRSNVLTGKSADQRFQPVDDRAQIGSVLAQFVNRHARQFVRQRKPV